MPNNYTTDLKFPVKNDGTKDMRNTLTNNRN